MQGQTVGKYRVCRLLLDELPEFSKNLETMNPCPCGYFGDDRKECTCGLGTVQRYQSRISGPLVELMDYSQPRLHRQRIISHHTRLYPE